MLLLNPLRLLAGLIRLLIARLGGRAAPSDDFGADDAAAVRAARPPASPEPTSAAGASGGVGGTMDAPGAAAAAGAPDPTTASVPQGARLARDVAPPPPVVPAPEPDEDQVVYSLGDTSADAGPNLRVDAPWEGYDAMTANEVVGRLRDVDATTRAVVALYEQRGKARKRVLSAASNGG